LHQDDPDVQLMLAFRGGDESAFESLFARWGRPLLRYLEHVVKDVGMAEELVQESFLRVHRARERYAPEARFSTWLYRIATNLAFNEMRRAYRRNPHQSLDAPVEGSSGAGLKLEGVIAAPGPGVDDIAAARFEGARVESALARLPDRQRMALWLSAVEGWRYAEIAEAMETSEKSIKALVHRARAGLTAGMATKMSDKPIVSNKPTVSNEPTVSNKRVDRSHE
jgi:RNA polymerase sigma-70 factor (ECF subfamily)